MKKFFQSKGFIVSSLALLCVTILGVCWFVSRDRTEDFRPDESPPSSVTGDWSDGGTQTDGDNGADAVSYTHLGTLICFDFQAEVLRSYCGSRMRFQTCLLYTSKAFL